MPRIISHSASPAGKASMVTVGIALAAAAGPLAFVAIEQTERAAEPNLADLTLPTGWSEAAPITSWKPAYANASVERQATYAQEDKPVGLYVGYYRNQDHQRKGKNLEFEPGKKIVQQWYFGDQPEESIVTIKLHEHPQGTSVELRHTNIPDEDYDDLVNGWNDEYFTIVTGILPSVSNYFMPNM